MGNRMGNRIVDPIVAQLMGLRYKSHPWHGIALGEGAPQVLTVFIEMVPTDTVKYEIDKRSGYLRLDRPNKYSNVVPALYGFLPQTYSGEAVANISREKTSNPKITGDGDPIDVCVLTEKEITHGNILVTARPIGGFCMLDGEQADDKIIAVLNNDAMYDNYHELSELPEKVVDRLKHYFMTYKDMPGNIRNVEIPHVYGREEAFELIACSQDDYSNRYHNIEKILLAGE